jgi:hypothetical protein
MPLTFPRSMLSSPSRFPCEFSAQIATRWVERGQNQSRREGDSGLGTACELEPSYIFTIRDTIEESLAFVAWVQRRNHQAYLAHRKRRETEG